MNGDSAADPRFLTWESRIVRGVRRPLNIGNPGAGNNWSVNVPGGRLWRVIAGTCSFTASGVVANRNVGLNMQLQGLPMFVNYNATAVTNGQNVSPVYMPGDAVAPAATINGILPVPFVPVWLRPGDTIRSITANFDPGDTYTQIVVWIEEAFFTDEQLPTTPNIGELEAMAYGGT